LEKDKHLSKLSELGEELQTKGRLANTQFIYVT